MKIVLDGHIFSLKAGTFVTRTPMVEWPDNIRLDGQQLRKDRAYLSSWAIDSWSNGLGVRRPNPNLASHQYRLWDAENVDTRFPNQIVLSPAFNTCTIVPSRGDLGIALSHLDQLYFIETARVATIQAGSVTSPAIAYQFSAPDTIGSFNQLAIMRASLTQPVGSLIAARAYGANIAFAYQYRPLGDQDGGQMYNWIPTLGGTINDGGVIQTDPETGNWGLLGTTSIGKYLRFGDMGGTLFILKFLQSLNKAGFYMANANLGSLVMVGSISAITGSYLSPLVTDGVTMFAQLNNGIYDFDLTPAIVVDTSDKQDKNGQQVMYNNNLYFKNNNQLIKYDGADINSVGYDQNDGLPSDKMGQITAMTSNYKWLYAAVKGATYSHILTYDGSAWQYFARIPSAGLWVKELLLNNSPDGIDRLWCLFDNFNYPGYFLNPVVNPLQAGTYNYAPTGHFTPADFGGGLDEEKGAFYDVIVTSEAVGLNTNEVRIFYGLNGGNPVTALGLISSLNGQLIFGSPYGVEAYRLTPKFALSRQFVGMPPEGTTPVFRSGIVHYLKDPDKRESFQFTVDIDQTARDGGLPPEGILGTLSTIQNSKILLPFWYGLTGTRHVKILDIPASDRILESKEIDAERGGMVTLRVAEIL